MKFVIEQPQDNPEPVVEFKAFIDNDGDFMVTANDKKLLFVATNDGTLNLVSRPDGIRGLKWKGSCIEVS